MLLLRQLRACSGISYHELARRWKEQYPRDARAKSTVADLFNRDTLPRRFKPLEQILTLLVEAYGGGPGEVQQYVKQAQRLLRSRVTPWAEQQSQDWQEGGSWLGGESGLADEPSNNVRIPAAVDAPLTDRERTLLRKLQEQLARREQDRYASAPARPANMYSYRTQPHRERSAAESFEDFADWMVSVGFWVPVSIYTTDDNGTLLKDFVLAVLSEFGFENAVEEPPVLGSWFQRLWARSRAVAGSEPVRERVAKLERALEVEGLGKRQAEIDRAKAESVAALYEVVREQENAVIRTGSIILIKTKGDIVVWTIGEMEVATLEKNSQLLRDPVAALKFLRGGKQGHELTDVTLPDGDALSD